jgi:hypothetical protein
VRLALALRSLLLVLLVIVIGFERDSRLAEQADTAQLRHPRFFLLFPGPRVGPKRGMKRHGICVRVEVRRGRTEESVQVVAPGAEGRRGRKGRGSVCTWQTGGDEGAKSVEMCGGVHRLTWYITGRNE